MTMRLAGLAAAVLLLPACHDEDELQITNLGASTVLVDVSWEEHADWCGCGWDDGHRLYEVPPGATITRDFGHVHDMDVLITRQSDGLVLFYEDFDAEDFDDDHGKIEVAVNP